MRTKTHLHPFIDTTNGHLNRWVQIVINIPSKTDVVENTIMLNSPYNVNLEVSPLNRVDSLTPVPAPRPATPATHTAHGDLVNTVKCKWS